MRFAERKQYAVQLPKWGRSRVLTYTGAHEGDYRCQVCEREGGTRKGWSVRHSFIEGDWENPTDQVIVGTECVKKCKIVPADERSEGHMRTVQDFLGEAGFPSAGRGMDWGDPEDVTPDNFEEYRKKVLDDKGIFVVSSMTRQTPIKGSILVSWEKHGKPFLKVSKDGKGFVMLAHGSYVRVAPYQVKYLPKEKIEEGREDLPVKPEKQITLYGVRKIAIEAMREFRGLHIAGLEQIQDNDGGMGGASRGAPQFKLVVAGEADGQALKALGDDLEKGIARVGPSKWARWAHVTVGGPAAGGTGGYVFILHMPPGVYVDKFWNEERDMDEFKRLVDLGDDLIEAVRPARQHEVAQADDEAVILFEEPGQARLIYDLLTGVTTGVKILEPGEVVLREISEWQQYSLNFAPHVRFLKPEVLAAVLDALADSVEEEAWGAAADALREDMAALVEFNPYHSARDGTFASQGQLRRAKAGSWSDGRRKNKVGKGKGKALKLVATSHPCGRDARDAGINKRCWDGAKVDWTGHAVARLVKRARKVGKLEGLLTADDRVILERARAVWAARAAALGEARGDKKKDKEITAIYEKWFENIPVNIMDLGKVRREIEALVAKGADLAREMPDIVKKYRAEAVEEARAPKFTPSDEQVAALKKWQAWHKEMGKNWKKALQIGWQMARYPAEFKETWHLFQSMRNTPGGIEWAMKQEATEATERSVRELLSELGGQTFGRSSRGRDPYWMTAKYAGKAQDGTPFKKGDRVFYYPATKTILAGAAAEKAAADFQGAVDDERQYNSGFEAVEDADLERIIEGMDEAALDALAAEIDERMDPEQRAMKAKYKDARGMVDKIRASSHSDMMASAKKISTKKIMQMLKYKGEFGIGPDTKRALFAVLRDRMVKSKKTGKLRMKTR